MLSLVLVIVLIVVYILYYYFKNTEGLDNSYINQDGTFSQTAVLESKTTNLVVSKATRTVFINANGLKVVRITVPNADLYNLNNGEEYRVYYIYPSGTMSLGTLQKFGGTFTLSRDIPFDQVPSDFVGKASVSVTLYKGGVETLVVAGAF